MRKISLFLLFSFLISGACLSAEETASASPKKVTAIEVKGNEAISANTVLSKMKARVGGAYNENIVNDDLKRLYLLGYFSDIKIDTQSYMDGIKLIITVKERPIIDKINFSGITRLTIKDDKLREELKSREGQYLDYPSLAEDARILKQGRRNLYCYRGQESAH
jgi:outer membrane protein insertion porin family